MKMRECPKFNACNAPICILDANWQLRRHHNEDACCFYLLESQKQGAEAIFRGAGREELYAIAIAVAPDIAERHAPIRRNIERCKTTDSRMNRFGGAALSDGLASEAMGSSMLASAGGGDGKK